MPDRVHAPSNLTPISIPSLRDAALSFTDDARMEWSAHDCTISQSRLVIVSIGSESAMMRIFRSSEGAYRYFCLDEQSSRASSPEMLAAQCRAARVMRRDPFAV